MYYVVIHTSSGFMGIKRDFPEFPWVKEPLYISHEDEKKLGFTLQELKSLIPGTVFTNEAKRFLRDRCPQHQFGEIRSKWPN